MARQLFLIFPPSLLHHLVSLSILANMVISAVFTEVNIKESICHLRFNFCAVWRRVSFLPTALRGDSVTFFEIKKSVGGWGAGSSPRAT